MAVMRKGQFALELAALRSEIEDQRGVDDLRHLRKIERWGRLCTLLGFATAWIAPNPLSALLLSQGRLTRWTMLAHHILHKSYDKIAGAADRHTSRRFAVGGRRLIDWMDWIVPQAWIEEHNVLHHYHLGERYDPDLVEAHMQWLRRSNLPMLVRYALVAAMAATWKWAYYAPNTTHVLHQVHSARQGQRSGLVERASPYRAETWNPRRPVGRGLWLRSLIPYALLQFVLIPALFLPLGPWAMVSVWLNSLLAEVFTNIHSFLMIIPNHCGEDLSRFDPPAGSREEFYLRQITGSVNYRCGADGSDFLHGWLNYHIEHHLWPDLTMLQYQRVQPKLRALCERHGLPYVQESVFRRASRALDIIVGRASMKRHRHGISSIAESN
jgi:fatty acid desaturase